MSGGFSVGLKLTDLNDFIAPSQECIKPVTVKKKETPKGTAIKVDTSGGYFQVGFDGAEKKLETASISLNDCLACSGCVTSAESVLVAAQSQKELYKVLENNLTATGDEKKIVVISLSPQSQASLGVKFQSQSNLEIQGKLVSFFKGLGVDFVFDTTFSRNLSLLETGKEFVAHYKEAQISKEKKKLNLPLLSSACPGWVCYAEKTHGEYVLPFISKVKSPQQMSGSLVKDYLAEKLSKRKNQIYHVSVMPCYDKKLEASRQDFYDDIYSCRDVDCVITSGEVELMLKEKNAELEALPITSINCFTDFYDPDAQTSVYKHAGGGSGGYAHFTFQYACQELFGIEMNQVNMKVLKNKDFQEVTLEVNDEVKLRFAIAYGFRNIQNIVQRVKRGRCTFDFVEVMACPQGCLNGGGQIKPGPKNDDPSDFSQPPLQKQANVASKLLFEEVASFYEKENAVDPRSLKTMDLLYNDWFQNDESQYKKLLYTQYHAVEKMKTDNISVAW